jgi:hypothetical protein
MSSRHYGYNFPIREEVVYGDSHAGGEGFEEDDVEACRFSPSHIFFIFNLLLLF